jgi:hypothetical protein
MCSNKHKYFTIRKILLNGVEPLVEIVADNLTQLEAMHHEMKLIQSHSSTIVNIAKGGDGGDTFSGQPKWKKMLIRKKLQNKKPTVHSEEWLKSLSEIRVGEGNPFFGMKHTPSTKKKCGAVWRGKKIPQDLIEKRLRISIYFVTAPHGDMRLVGRKNFEKHFMDINKEVSYRNRVNWQKLLRTHEDKGYSITKIEEVPLSEVKHEL